ncbi:MAG: hypothetical protein LLF75_02525 [Eubacteriales bacterium]|nr:hypothetical protein [Eubacteriales bacterium]
MPYEQSARTRILRVLRGQSENHVPFTTYSLFSELSTFEREMRQRGLGYVAISSSYEIVQKQAIVREIRYRAASGDPMIRTEYETPFGTLYTEQKPQPELYTNWTKEHLFKSEDDYKALLWLVKDQVTVPRYDRAAKLVSALGEDFAVRDQIPLEPLQNLISSVYMDAQTFSLEWYDNRDEILKLYDAFRELNRSIYPIVANGPLEFMNYGGNVIPAIIGKKNFAEYYVPNYNEAAEIVHRTGKLLGTHLDDNNETIMAEIASADLDYIEAYDPVFSPPLETAFAQFRKKAIWINWPSAWHAETPERAEQLTSELLSRVKPSDRLLLAVTENMPVGRDRELFPAILNAIQSAGR